MGNTSFGSVTVGLVLTVLGIAAIAAGGNILAHTAFAEENQQQEEYGPFGLFGESESSSTSANLAPVFGLVLAGGGLAASITGLVITARSFERGKDREVHEE